MADPGSSKAKDNGKAKDGSKEVVGGNAQDMFVKPVVTAFKVIVLFLDVATLMVRLLFNTVVYDTPQGKQELVERE